MTEADLKEFNKIIEWFNLTEQNKINCLYNNFERLINKKNKLEEIVAKQEKKLKYFKGFEKTTYDEIYELKKERRKRYDSYIANSLDWQAVRKLVLKRDNYTCCNCNNPEGLPLHVHHITYDNLYNEKEHLDELITLCSDCHADIHHIKRQKKTQLEEFMEFMEKKH